MKASSDVNAVFPTVELVIRDPAVCFKEYDAVDELATGC